MKMVHNYYLRKRTVSDLEHGESNEELPRTTNIGNQCKRKNCKQGKDMTGICSLLK